MITASFPNRLTRSMNRIEGREASPNTKVQLEIFFEGDDHFDGLTVQANADSEGNFHLGFKMPTLDVKPGMKAPDTTYLILTDLTTGCTQATDYTWAQ